METRADQEPFAESIPLDEQKLVERPQVPATYSTCIARCSRDIRDCRKIGPPPARSSLPTRRGAVRYRIGLANRFQGEGSLPSTLRHSSRAGTSGPAGSWPYSLRICSTGGTFQGVLSWRSEVEARGARAADLHAGPTKDNVSFTEMIPLPTVDEVFIVIGPTIRGMLGKNGYFAAILLSRLD